MKSIRPLQLAFSNEIFPSKGEVKVTDHYVLSGFTPLGRMVDDSLPRVSTRAPVEVVHFKLSSAMRQLHLLSVFGNFREEVIDLQRELRLLKRWKNDNAVVYIRCDVSLRLLEVEIFESLIS
jgi:hypothetical protein